MDTAMEETQNPDIAVERSSPAFQLEEMTNFIDGGKDQTAMKREIWQKVLNHPALKKTEPTDYMSHEQKYNYNMKRALVVLNMVNSEAMSVDQISKVMSHNVAGFTTPDGNPIAVHQVMFIPTLMNQADDDQMDRWLGDAYNGRIIGTYAQTELGHGTFVRGLRTTATYDPASRTFDLHTPDLSAAKWWPGGLGTSANYAVVMARLYTGGLCRGIHPFMVQLRDMETHLPLKGVTLGEIGPKLGNNTLNNGYLLFDHVKVPLNNMLMRNARVDENGSYIKPPHSKLGYGTMVFTRVSIVKDTVDALQIAVTIACRYSVVRRQGQPGPSGLEPQIIDFQTQQLKVLPHLASCYLLRTAATRLWDQHTQVTSEIRGGDMALLPELHATSCCLKALVTSDAQAAIETLRMACGGHGYMTASRFPALYAYATAGATYEGENTVLLLQTARYLVKKWSAGVAPPAGSSVAYLWRSAEAGPWRPDSVQSYVVAFGRVARGRVLEVAARLRADTDRLKDESAAWNASLAALVETALAHCRYYVVHSFMEVLADKSTSRGLHQVLLLLAHLYVAYYVSRAEGDFVTYGGLTSADLLLNRGRLLSLLTEVRAHMIPLTDAFDMPDRLIQSTLGVWDGNVYHRMFEEAKRSPMNVEEVPHAFEAIIKPMRSHL